MAHAAVDHFPVAHPLTGMAAAVLPLVAGLLAGGLHGASSHPPAAAVETRLASPAAARAPGIGPTKVRAARSSPVSLRIPALRLTASVGPLGLNPDRTVQVPKDPGRAGWYRFGPSPGQPGSAVILGHVDSKTGPAVFYRLGALRAGDSIMVTLADGVVAHFRVNRVVAYPNAKFPASKVYRSTGQPSLTLVTCGGPYDHRARAYTENIVIYTSLVYLTRTGQHVSR